MTKLRTLINSYIFKSSQNFFFEKNEFIKIVELMRDLVEKNNSQLYFVYLPEYSTFKHKIDHQNYKKIKKIILENNIKFIDIKETFKKNKNPFIFFPFELTGHYNEKGYSKVAKEIYTQIE